MIAIALTGGIGSGKSTVGALFAARGAIVVEADEVARAALAPGGSGLEAVLSRFPDARAASGELDRKALAGLVFADARARADLEAIVHPVVRAELLGALEAHHDEDVLVVLDVPLFVETGGRDRYPVDGVVVVDAPEEVARNRLVSQRGMTGAEADERIAAQAGRAERLAAADFAIYNVGSLDELSAMVERALEWAAGLGGTGARP